MLLIKNQLALTQTGLFVWGFDVVVEQRQDTVSSLLDLDTLANVACKQAG